MTESSRDTQKLVDDLDQATAFARGIEAALGGLECLDKGMLEGVQQLQRVHIETLERITGALR